MTADREFLFRARYAVEKVNEQFRQFAQIMSEAQTAELERLRETRRVASQREAKRAADFEKAYQEWKANQEASDDC